MHIKLKRSPGIYLAGFMGSGKSTVGRILADRLGWSFADVDREIEGEQGATIAKIFQTRGEPEFRSGEARVIARLLESGTQVVHIILQLLSGRPLLAGLKLT